MSHWAEDAFFYHVYPLGLCGAPARNDFAAAPEPRLARLHDWLPHLQELGVNALYVGPVFESTAHGYDTADYYTVDRRLGTRETLRNLVQAAHERQIRVILDGVFNHVGRDFWAFRDVLANGTNSPYRDWFAGLRFDARSPLGDPFSYEAWAGHFDLVKLNTGNPAVREHLFGAVEMWIEELGIDGLRLDAADVLDLGFQRDLAAFARARKPDFFLLGEVVHSDYRRWANPETLDATTNYEAFKGLYSSLNDRNYFEIAYALNRQFGPTGVYRGLPLYNFVDNHDQDRIGSRLARREYLYPLHALLFTMPGMPSIYYGSEWAIEGKRGRGDDSPVRPALELATAPALGLEPELAGWIARLARIRAELPALRHGAYRQLLVQSEQFAFVREFEGQRAVVILNASDRPVRLRVPVWAGIWQDALSSDTLTSADGWLEAELVPFSARILVG